MKLRYRVLGCGLLVLLLACGCQKDLPATYRDVAQVVVETEGKVDMVNADGSVAILYAGSTGKDRYFDAYERALLATGWTKKPLAPELGLPPTSADYEKDERRFSILVDVYRGHVVAILALR